MRSLLRLLVLLAAVCLAGKLVNKAESDIDAGDDEIADDDAFPLDLKTPPV